MASRQQVTEALIALGDAAVAAVNAIKNPPAPTPTEPPVSDEPEFLDGVLAQVNNTIATINSALGVGSARPSAPKQESQLCPVCGKSFNPGTQSPSCPHSPL